ncbi:hypothetical protein [uncultured Salinibacterium sp.]|uniref:hypothetical protein n=1 Tax=uncultured Salinibacterium sp. TaxID=459274 RepID=UPI0030DB37B3|tara:strand:- start:123589 stop:124029 length:441 start_codon:yes stop_codon:yes gene_type:complete
MYKAVETATTRLNPWNMWPSEPPPLEIEIADATYRTHPTGGGLVAITAHVGPSVYVDRCAMIKGRAVVVGSVRLFGKAVIEEDAVVTDFCTLRDKSSIGGRAIVRGGVQLADNARVDGLAHISGGVLLQHFARISQGIFSGSMTVA